jgi:cysteine synthase A
LTLSLTASSPPIAPVANARLHGLSQLIGNTPLLEIDLLYKGSLRTIFAKYETMNLTGSIKDRMVFNIFQAAYADGTLRAGDLVVEATSGNTGISCAAIGRALGHPVQIFMPAWMSKERVLLIRSFGAEVELLSREQGGFLGSIALCEQLARERNDIFLPRQFSNRANVLAHFAGTGPEIWRQLEACGRRPDAFVAGVGTGGTVMGTGKFLRQNNPLIKVHPVEPLESPTLSTGYKIGSHRIQGISDDFIPDVIDFSHLDDVLQVSDGDSIIMAQKIASELGLGVGISSGCNLIAAIRAQERLGPSATVVTVFCDDNKKYLTTDLLRHEPVAPGYLSSDVSLLAVQSHARCCIEVPDRQQ